MSPVLNSIKECYNKTYISDKMTVLLLIYSHFQYQELLTSNLAIFYNQYKSSLIKYNRGTFSTMALLYEKPGYDFSKSFEYK